MEPLWDVMVVGAGPAGCAAAYDLAAGGASVVLLDKHIFPRQKACAGGLTAKALQTLRYPIEPVVQRTIRQIRLEGEGVAPVVLSNQEPICVMTVRSELDAFCLQKTIAAGAVFRRIGAIRQIARSALGVELLLSDGSSYRARYLIGADGASGQVRRLCAAGSWFAQGFALEVRTRPVGAVDLTFDFASVSNGYAWIFPKQEHWNVGLYIREAAGGLTRDRLLTYVRQRLGTEILDQVTGQYLGLGAEVYQADDLRADLRDRVFLVGDAGGFADALTGEGIYGALHTGQAAARAILGMGNAAAAFASGVDEYRQTLRFSARAGSAFYADPARGFRAMRVPFVRKSLVRTYTHGLNVKSLAMRVALSRC